MSTCLQFSQLILWEDKFPLSRNWIQVLRHFVLLTFATHYRTEISIFVVKIITNNDQNSFSIFLCLDVEHNNRPRNSSVYVSVLSNWSAALFALETISAAIDWFIPYRPWRTIKFSSHSGYFSVSCVFHDLVTSNLNFNLWSPTWIPNNELKFKRVLYHNLDKKSDLEQTSTLTDPVRRFLYL